MKSLAPLKTLSLCQNSLPRLAFCIQQPSNLLDKNQVCFSFLLVVLNTNEHAVTGENFLELFQEFNQTLSQN